MSTWTVHLSAHTWVEEIEAADEDGAIQAAMTQADDAVTMWEVEDVIRESDDDGDTQEAAGEA